ncbi:MAG: PAS domain-containing protein [Armatimonadetes bacterium]|nr:PAS domain-containing protein [Armatimonadota bacterium]
MAHTPEELFEKVAGARREWLACFDAITDWVFVKGPDLRIMKANRAAAALFSRVPQQLIGHSCQELFSCDAPPADERVVQQTFETGQPQSADVRDMPVAGEFHVATYPLQGDAGEVVAVVEYVRDVTEQKAMHRQLLQSARLAAVGELAAGVAHNFGNILMGVGGSLEVMLLMAEGEGFSPRVVERMQLMHRELMRGDNIVKRLLSFARGSAPCIRAVPLGDVMDGVVALCQAHPLSSGIAVEWEMPIRHLAVRADPAQLREVLMNLVLNALQATPKGGRVRLMARPESGSRDDDDWGWASRPSRGGHRTAVGERPCDPRVSLLVGDTGCGIAEEDMPRLFTPFFSHRSDGSQGTGLGLCVSLGMVQAMGGEITAESLVGKGTTFIISLPAAARQGGGK